MILPLVRMADQEDMIHYGKVRPNLDEYSSEIEKASAMIRIIQTLGRDEWVHKNQEYLDRLIQMHDELEKKGIIHKSGSMREA